MRLGIDPLDRNKTKGFQKIFSRPPRHFAAPLRGGAPHTLRNTALGDEVAAKNWKGVSRPWVPVTSESIPDFPELSENELEVFFTGTYQVGQSVSYLADMLEEDDTPLLQISRITRTTATS